MEQGFKFNSPSVQFRENVLIRTSENTGNGTSLGVVGEFERGAAFLPIQLTSKDSAFAFLGRQNSIYPASFSLYNFLDEANDLYVTRILGLSGYNAGKAWVLTARGGVDTANITSTNTISGATETVTGGTFQGAILPSTTGETLTIEPDFVFDGTEFTGTTYEVEVLGYSASTNEYFIQYDVFTNTAPVLSEYEDTVLAVLRSRGRYNGETQEFDVDTVIITGETGTSLYDEFTLIASNSATNESETYVLSMNPNNRNYIVNVLGDSVFGKENLLWVEKVYPESVTTFYENDYAYNVKAIEEYSSSTYANYAEQYKGGETPWIVSELRGNKITRLFKINTWSDGDISNKLAKVSFTDINPQTKEFTLLVRDFNDTDENITILESFTRCTMNKNSQNYIGKRIGAIDSITNEFIYPRKSEYIYLNLDENHPNDSFPCGFEGYELRSFENAKLPKIFYKTSYSNSDRVGRNFLGVSEKAYTNSFGRSTASLGLNEDLFEYFGVDNSTNTAKTNGFHMDSEVSGNTYVDGSVEIGSFDGGAASFKDINDILDESNPYNNTQARKFTVVFKGGFDGWDIYRTERTNTDSYAPNSANYSIGNDWDAYKAAIDTFDNAEEVDVNLIITPDINWFDNRTLVNEMIEIVEADRKGDSVYIVDPPDITGADLAKNVADLFELVDINSVNVTTYAPWVELVDSQNNQSIWLPPSVDVIRNIAITDKVAAPWFATAGLNRGVLRATRARVKLTERMRDTLYSSRINPIKTDKNNGILIYGNKTSFVGESNDPRIFLNIRRLIITATERITSIAETLLFEPNDSVVRTDFENRVNSYLTDVRRERGLIDFRIVGDNLNPEVLDRGEMYFNLLLKPTRALEYIGIDLTLTPTGVDFNDLIGTIN